MAERAADLLSYPVIPIPDEVALSSESVIRYLVGQMVERALISPEQAARAVCQVIHREHLGSTALATGVAVPHSKTEVLAPVGIVGRSSVPIPWESPDGVPVHEVCVLLLPVNDPQEFMRALREAVRAFRGLSGHP